VKRGNGNDVDLQWQTKFDEGGRSSQSRRVGFQIGKILEAEETAIIEHVDHGKGLPGVWKPGMRRGVQLPEFAELAGAAAADRGCGR